VPLLRFRCRAAREEEAARAILCRAAEVRRFQEARVNLRVELRDMVLGTEKSGFSEDEMQFIIL
jgi:hypothetical protein